MLSSNNPIKITVYKELESFLTLREEWNELLDNSFTNTIFLRFEWLEAWLESMGGDRNLFVVTIREENQLVLAAPFCFTKRAFGACTIAFLGDGYADLSDILVRRGYEYALTSLWTWLTRVSNFWDCLDLKFVPEDMLLLRDKNLFTQTKSIDISFKLKMSSPFLKIENQWRDHLSRQYRQQIGRKRRRLEDSYGKLLVEIATTPNDVQLALDIFYSMHQQRWIGMKKDISNYAITSVRDQHQKLFMNLASSEYTFVMILKTQEKPVAVVINMIYEGRMYYCQPTFDPEFSKFSPSQLLIAELLDYCVVHNISVFDFLRGDEGYKFEWTADKIQLYNLYINKSNIKAKLAKLWYLNWRDNLRNASLLGGGIRKLRWYLRSSKSKIKG